MITSPVFYQGNNFVNMAFFIKIKHLRKFLIFLCFLCVSFENLLRKISFNESGNKTINTQHHYKTQPNYFELPGCLRKVAKCVEWITACHQGIST